MAKEKSAKQSATGGDGRDEGTFAFQAEVARLHLLLLLSGQGAMTDPRGQVRPERTTEMPSYRNQQDTRPSLRTRHRLKFASCQNPFVFPTTLDG